MSVKDGDSQGIGGATVKLTNTTTSAVLTKVAGSAGGCNFTEVPIGSYSVEVTADDYTTYTSTLTVDGNETLNVVMTSG